MLMRLLIDLDKTTLDKIKEEAEKNNRSRKNQIEKILSDYIKSH